MGGGFCVGSWTPASHVTRVSAHCFSTPCFAPPTFFTCCFSLCYEYRTQLVLLRVCQAHAVVQVCVDKTVPGNIDGLVTDILQLTNARAVLKLECHLSMTSSLNQGGYAIV